MEAEKQEGNEFEATTIAPASMLTWTPGEHDKLIRAQPSGNSADFTKQMDEAGRVPLRLALPRSILDPQVRSEKLQRHHDGPYFRFNRFRLVPNIKGLRACWFLCQGGSPEPPSRTDCRQEANNTVAWRQAISCGIVFVRNRVGSRLEGYPDLTCISAALSKLDCQVSTVEAVCVVSELVRLATYSAIQRRKSVFPCISHGDRCPMIRPTSPTSSPNALIGSHPLAFPEHAVKIPFETSCFRGGTSSELSRFPPALCWSASRSCTGTRHVSNSRISSYSSLSLSPETSSSMGAQGVILDGWRSWNVHQLP